MLFNTNFSKKILGIGKKVFRLSPSISRSVTTSSNVATVDLAYSICDNCSETSTKPPLIIFHGLAGSQSDVNGFVKATNLATGRRVITIDARNHGDSPHTPQHTYLLMAHDVIELLKKLELQKVSVLGHSMGGHTAMVLALIRPDLVSSLIVEDMSPVRTSNRALSMLKLLQAMANMDIRSDISISKAKELAHEHLKTVTYDVIVRNYLIENLVKTNSGLFKWKCNIPVFQELYLTNILKFPSSDVKGFQYTGPTLFIAGSLSDFIRSSDLPEMRKYFPSAEITFVDGAGHWVHTQRREEFIEILCKFLIEK